MLFYKKSRLLHRETGMIFLLKGKSYYSLSLLTRSSTRVFWAEEEAEAWAGEEAAVSPPAFWAGEEATVSPQVFWGEAEVLPPAFWAGGEAAVSPQVWAWVLPRV